MNCKKILELSGSYIDNELTLVQKNEIGEHLGMCSSCREFINDMRRVDTLTKLYEPSISEDYWTDFMPRLHRRIFSEGIKKREPFSWWRTVAFRYALGFSVILLVVSAALILYLLTNQQESKVTVPMVYITALDRDARVNNYLTNSEIVLIKLVAMPEERENWELLKEDITQAGLTEQIDSNMDVFQEDPQLLSHAKAMEMICIKVLNADEKNYREDLELLKAQIIKSGILEKTQSMKL